MKHLISALGFFLFFSSFPILAQPNIQWQKCLGGTGNDEGAESIRQTSDGGYIVAGRTNSTDGDVSGFHGIRDFWITKLDASGNLSWQKSLGGSNDEFAKSVDLTSDGGYIVAGPTRSNDGNVSGNKGGQDFWLVRLNPAGDLLWQKCLGGPNTDFPHSVRHTSDGGFIVAGFTDSNSGDVSGYHGGQFDWWVVKLDASGNIVWQKCFGGSAEEKAYAIEQTSDGGYIASGFTASNDQNVSGNNGGMDYWVVKMDAAGNLTWQDCFGGYVPGVGNWGEHAYSVKPTSDGGYIVGGFACNNNGDISGNHNPAKVRDFWLVRLNSSGNMLWQKCLGGADHDYCWSIIATTDGGFMAAGSSYSIDGDVTGNHGEVQETEDAWIVKVNAEGNMVWQKCLGGTEDDSFSEIRPTADGGFIAAGVSQSVDGDVTGLHGFQDFWVVKLSADPTEIQPFSSKAELLRISPNPSAGNFLLQADASLTGKNCRVYNSTGQLVLEYKISQTAFSISLENQPSGIYSIGVEGEAGAALRVIRE